MKYILKTSLLVITLLLLGNHKVIANSFFVHIDKPFYATGETVWYKVYYPSAIDKVAIKVLLVDDEGKVVQYFFQQSEKSNYLSGHISLPYNYRSGVYRLVFNANLNTQEPIVDAASNSVSLKDIDKELTLTEISFPIYNDLSAIAEGPSSNNEGSNTSTNTTADYSLNITPSIKNTNVNAKEKIEISIDVNQSGNPSVYTDISVSVIPKAIRETTQLGFQYLTQGDLFNEKQVNFLGKDVFLKGSVYSTGDKALQLNVIGAYTNKLNTMYYTKSNSEGSFTLNFPQFYDKQSVQFLSYEQEVDKFVIKPTPHNIPQKSSAALIHNEEIEKILVQSRKRKKLMQYFDYLGSSIETKNNSNTKEASKSDVKYIVAEYENFDKVYDFFSELITPLQFKTVKGKIVATMTNPKSSHAVTLKLPGSPLFILDGKATRNADYAGLLSMSNIESIELFYSPVELRQQFNVLGSSGVVRINTLTPLFDVPESDVKNLVEIQGLNQEGRFDAFTPKSNEKNLPYFLSTIYWNADLKTSSDGKANFSFYQSDDLGDFSIIIVALDQNGNRGVQVLDYTVE